MNTGIGARAVRGKPSLRDGISLRGLPIPAIEMAGYAQGIPNGMRGETPKFFSKIYATLK